MTDSLDRLVSVIHRERLRRIELLGRAAETADWSWPYPCHSWGHVYEVGNGRCVECGVPDFDALDLAAELERNFAPGAEVRLTRAVR